MTRLVPHPLLAAALFLMWLVLGTTYSAGWILLGIPVAVGGAWAMSALRLDRPRLRRPGAALRLARLVVVDVIRSNLAVARIIAGRGRQGTSSFMTIPLDLRDPGGLAILACILTATPGTIWMSYERATGVLLLHILDLVDEAAWIRLVKRRYEPLLLEIFE